MHENKLITKVKANSPAAIAGVQAGEFLLSVNDQEFSDIIDLSFLFSEEQLILRLCAQNGQERPIIIKKKLDQDIGLEFAGAVFDRVKECGNACMFCFVDQLPPGMRAGLYVKDDDYRLSFLYGNFITFTNFTPADEERILRLHLSPLYVSVQATDEIIRQKLLGSKRANELMPYLKNLAAQGVRFHTQVVLCPGINDGSVLEKTFNDLWALKKAVISMAVVPVGLTRYHRADNGLRLFTGAEAKNIIKTVAAWQKKCRAQTGRNFVYLADEFYLLADEELPAAKEYDGFPQYENGVGLARKFIDEWQAEKINACSKQPESYILCGLSARHILLPLLQEANKYTGVNHQLLCIENSFFGKTVTVTGLLTGQDILAGIRSSLPYLPKRFILPGITLRRPENDFLDGMTLAELKQNIPCDIKIADNAVQLKRFLFN